MRDSTRPRGKRAVAGWPDWLIYAQATVLAVAMVIGFALQIAGWLGV